MNIVTRYVWPPIPDRSCDWSAIDADSYDYDAPIGYGPTAEAARADLLEQIKQAQIEAAWMELERELAAWRARQSGMVP